MAEANMVVKVTVDTSEALAALRRITEALEPEGVSDPVLVAVDAVVEAWVDPGPNARYHYAQWEALRTGWPSLHRAIRALVAEARRG